jgi:hypothetical protein
MNVHQDIQSSQRLFTRKKRVMKNGKGGGENLEMGISRAKP